MYYLSVELCNENGRNKGLKHVCGLSLERNIYPVFGFISKVTERGARLLHIKKRIELISDGGDNKKINHIELLMDDNPDYLIDTYRAIPVYKCQLSYVNNANNEKLNAGNGIIGQVTDDDIFVEIDYTQYDRSDFILVFEYKEGDNAYRYAFRVYTYFEDNNLANVALDFGSEASQIRFEAERQNNINIIEELAGLCSDRVNNPPYYQSDGQNANDNRVARGEVIQRQANLFKSVFYINTNPGTTKFGDSPMQNGSNNFVHTLISTNESRDYFNGLKNLPNLKLAELAVGDRLTFDNTQIHFPEGSNVGAPGVSLASEGQRDNIMRLILSDFLNVIIKHAVGYGDVRYIRLFLMVPNVYGQDKVYKLLDGLYRDFDIIINNNKNNKGYTDLKGFEVRVISESDASFVGVVQNGYLGEDISNGNYLIIDAGKGTTDFSIVNKNDDKYVSMYRYGIPASGNAITYSFYEALNEFFCDNNIRNIGDLLRARNTTPIMLSEFMNKLDILKKNYDIYKKDINPESNPPECDNLDNVIEYIDRYLIKAGIQIPDVKNYIEGEGTNTARLVSMLERALKKYIEKKSNFNFEKVILTGRGFLFKPFSEAVINMLRKNKYIKDGDDNVVRLEGDSAKTICMDGALDMGNEIVFENTSGLVGYPEFYRAYKFKEKPFYIIIDSLCWLICSLKRGVINALQGRGYYDNGIRLYAKKAKLLVSGRDGDIPCKNREKVLYYTGKGFLCHCLPIIHGTKDVQDVNLLVRGGNNANAENDIMYRSMFPYCLLALDNDRQNEDFNRQPQENIPLRTEDEVINTDETSIGNQIDTNEIDK